MATSGGEFDLYATFVCLTFKLQNQAVLSQFIQAFKLDQEYKRLDECKI